MNYVFYDFETSGRSSSWDQIIEVGAVLVNDDFKVLADPLNIRCSLKPGLVPEPYALIVNNTTPQILRKTNLSHYGMLSQMVEQFRGIKVSADKIQSRAEKIQELESKDEITK